MSHRASLPSARGRAAHQSLPPPGLTFGDAHLPLPGLTFGDAHYDRLTEPAPTDWPRAFAVPDSEQVRKKKIDTERSVPWSQET